MFTLWRGLQHRTGVNSYSGVMYIFLFKPKSSKLLFIVESSSYLFRNEKFALKTPGEA